MLAPYQPPTSSRSSGVSLSIPDASTIFHRFHAWLASQRFVRREHVVERRRATTQRESHAAERAESLRRVVEGKRAERAARRKARQQQSEQRALLKQAQMGATKTFSHLTPTASSSGTDSASPPTEAEPPESDTEFEADMAEAVEQVKNEDNSSAPELACFAPSLFSYPRLQFSDDGNLLSGESKSVQKFQAHVCEVTSSAEVQAAWAVAEEMLTQGTRTKDEAVRDRTFAFLLAEGGVAERNSTTAFGSTASPGSEQVSPLLLTRTIDAPTSALSSHPESVMHGFDDGQVKGSGGRLLDLLRELGLTNIFVLITSSGLATSAPTASSYGGVGSSARSRASRVHHAQKVARIMLEDFARVRTKLDQQQDGGRTVPEHKDLMVITTEKIEDGVSPALANNSGANAILPRQEIPAIGVYALLPGATEPVPIPPLLITKQMLEQHRQQLILHEQSTSGQQQLLTHDPSSRRSHVATHPGVPIEELNFLTPAEEEILKSEFLSLLSGHAFLKMNSLNLSKDGGKNRPYFFTLWQAYLLRLHPPQEKPDVAKLSDAAGLAATTLARNRALFSEKELLLQQEISLPTNDGRMAANLQPNARTAQRIAEKIQSYSKGAEGMMLDGFHSDRTSQQQRRRRDPLDPSNGPSTQRSHLQLRRGAGQPGRSGLNAATRPLIVRASIVSPTFTPQEQALLDMQQTEAEELEKLSAAAAGAGEKEDAPPHRRGRSAECESLAGATACSSYLSVSPSPVSRSTVPLAPSRRLRVSSEVLPAEAVPRVTNAPRGKVSDTPAVPAEDTRAVDRHLARMAGAPLESVASSSPRRSPGHANLELSLDRPGDVAIVPAESIRHPPAAVHPARSSRADDVRTRGDGGEASRVPHGVPRGRALLRGPGGSRAHLGGV